MEETKTIEEVGTNPTTSQEGDNASSLANLLEAEEEPTESTQPAETEETEKSPEEFVFTGDDESVSEDGTDEEDGLPPETLPELDAELAKNPALLKRWQEQQKGVEKLVNRWKSNLEVLGQTVAKLSEIQSYVEKFENPSTWKEGLKELAERLSRHYGEPLDEIFGKQATENLTWDTDDQEALKKIEERAYQKAVAEIERRLAPALDFLSTQMLEKSAERKAVEAIPKLEREYGMKIAKEAVIKAIQKYPELDPVSAFNACYAPQIAKHYAQYRESLNKKPKHELISGERLVSGERRAIQEGATFEEILEGEF